jgi:3-oxoacid CoA-transferase A subunit
MREAKVKNKIYATFDEAVADIPDGASIMLGGFGPGTPWNLFRALHKHGAKQLALITNSATLADSEGQINIHHMVEAGQIRKITASFTANPHPSRTSAFERLVEAGAMEAELVPQGTLAERIRAGGAGIPAFYTPAGVGTEMAEGKEHRVFNGRTYIMEEALTADYAFIRAWKADTFGNLVFRLAQRNYNPLMAAAARITIVEVEEPIVPEGSLSPDQIHTSGIFVDRLVEIPLPPLGILHPRRPSQPPPKRPGTA